MIRPQAMPRDATAPGGRRLSAALTVAVVAAGLAALAASAGCSFHYAQGQALEARERWEEAAIEYRLAFVEDPDDPDFRTALERMNKVVARENFERYEEYLAGKGRPAEELLAVLRAERANAPANRKRKAK